MSKQATAIIIVNGNKSALNLFQISKNSGINSVGDDVIMREKELVDEDISDPEWNLLHAPYEENLHNYFKLYAIPEIFCFTLSNAYSRGVLGSDSLIRHYYSMTDVVLITTDLENIRPLVDDLLHIKYNLHIASEDPLVLEKWQGMDGDQQ